MPTGIYTRTEETRKKMSLSKLGNKHSFGIVRSEEFKKKVSIAMSGENHPLFGKGGTRGGYKDGRMSDRKYYVWLHNKRNRQLKSSEGSHTFEEWENLKKIFNYTCPSCLKKEDEITLSIDHIIPLSKGGTNYISNIQPLCRSCNSKKNVKTIIYQPITQNI